MIRSFLIGVVAGARSITPIAAVTEAARRGELPDNDVARLIGHPLFAAGAGALAVAEMAGDKWSRAPDRIDIRGIAARVLSAGIAGAAVAPRKQQVAGAAVAVATATVFAYITFTARMQAMRKFGQASTGFVEDAIILGSTAAIVHGSGAQGVKQAA